MRIAFFHSDHPLEPTAPHAGAETAVMATARALARRGHAVTVVGALRRDVTVDGVRYLCAGPARGWDVELGLARIVDETDALVSTMAAGVLAASARYPGIRERVLWPHVACVDALGVPLARMGEVADRVVCVSDDQADVLVAAGLPRALATVIRHGVDHEVFHPDDAVPRGAARIVFAGALVPDKGLDVLLHAMPMVRALVPEAELVVCGSSALWGREPYIDPDAVRRELPCVTFRGALGKAALAGELRRAAVAVVPTPAERWRETFGLVALEAQACGTPVIAVRHGGLVETLREGETGWFVERSTPAELAAAIVAALRAPARLALMGRNAARWAAGFSWERSAEAWEALLGAAAPPAPRRAAAPADAGGPPVAVVTTWRQPCGLARYAEDLVAALPRGRVRVLAEACDAPLDGPAPDVPVERCWRRGEPLDELVATAEALGVRLVHVNHHGGLFGDRLGAALRELAARGIRSTVTLHAPNQIDPEIAAIGRYADALVVHNEGVRLEVVANGVAPAKVRVIPPGMRPLATGDPAALRREMGLQPGEKLVASLGFLQPHKGFEDAIRAVAALRAQLPVQYLVLGGVQPGDAAGVAYKEALLAEARRLGVADAVTIVGEYLPDATVAAYLRAADAIVLPYRTSWWEASAAAREALASGRPVVTSAALAFADLGGAVFRTTGAFHTAAALAAVLTQPELADELVAEAGRLAERTAWPVVAGALDRVWDEALARAPARRGAGGGAPRVSFHVREHASRTGGGDWIVADTIARNADPARVEIVVREGGPVAADAFLAHLFNLSTYTDTAAHARRAVELGVPYVVSAMYEDWPRFKVAAERRVQAQRQALGLPPSVDVEAYARMHAGEQRDLLAAIGFVAQHARAVIATGASEKHRLERDFPGVRTRIIPIAVPDRGPGDPDAFVAKYGTRDFVLCVGRIEPRKNQLTLLEALADDPVDVVLASGGYAYRQDYLEACRAFRRRGRTIYLPHLTDAELVGAYRAARLHVLASWFELPGLVTMEALLAGCAAVATRWGTLPDYLGDAIPYAEPDDPDGLRRAIADAAGWDFAEARARAAQFGVARNVEAWTALYEEIVGHGGLHVVPPRRRRASTGASPAALGGSV